MTKKEKSAIVLDEFPVEEMTEAAPTPPASTLIEFPRAGRRGAIPPWRKELNERVREIQQRRAQEAALEAEERALAEGRDFETQFIAPDAATATHQLGLVPQPEMPEPNPIVAKALRRVERARQQAAQAYAPQYDAQPASPSKLTTQTARPRPAEGQQKTTARVGDAPTTVPAAATPTPQPDVSISDAPAPTVQASEEVKVEAPRAPSLIAVLSPPPAKETVSPEVALPDTKPAEAQISLKVEPPAPSVALPDHPVDKRPAEVSSAAPVKDAAPVTETIADSLRRNAGKVVIDDSWLTRLEAEILPKVKTAQRAPDDTAPTLPRVTAALIDLLLITFLSSPFAAVIELTSGNWTDPRVAASMAGVVLVLMFLYLTGSTALAGRTWGMSLFSLHTVDAETALSPTVGQSARRTLAYMLSLATFGIGIIYALFDAERRTAHDHLSGTVIVRG